MASQTYHSSHGAIQESQHIFISQLSNANFQHSRVNLSLSVLEIGFGTGLNALLTAQYACEHNLNIEYSTIELYPLDEEIYQELNYGKLLGREELFLKLHEAKWDVEFVQIDGNFAIKKCKCDIVEWLKKQAQNTINIQFDVVFFDAFSPDAQPELWSNDVFANIYKLMNKGGVMTTYCAKGDVRRAMLAAGFNVEKLQGPPGKRHILRAIKI